MPRFRNQMQRRGPSPIYKKRFVSFLQTAANSTPQQIAQIVIAETGTIVSLKVNIGVISLASLEDDIQETRLFVYCQQQNDQHVPDPTATTTDDYVANDLDGINGFTLPSLFSIDPASGLLSGAD